MRDAKLKYDTDLNFWIIDTDNEVIKNLNSFYLEIAIKVGDTYRFCELIYDEKELNYCADFLTISFYLDKSCIYEVKFQIWAEEIIPF